jgi:hypothetical protein
MIASFLPASRFAPWSAESLGSDGNSNSALISNGNGRQVDYPGRLERRTDFYGRISLPRLRLFVSNPVVMLEVQMRAQYSKQLNGWLSSGKVLCVSLLTICIFAGPQARAACPLVVPSGVEMTEKVRAIVGSKTNEGDLARCYLRYMDALKHPEKIDDIATPDARFHDLEAAGYPKGPEGLKAFRRWLNAQVPDEHGLITAMRFPGNGIIEVDIEASGRDPKTGQPALLTVHAKDRFVGDRIAERGDTAVWHTPFPKGSNAKD